MFLKYEKKRKIRTLFSNTAENTSAVTENAAFQTIGY